MTKSIEYGTGTGTTTKTTSKHLLAWTLAAVAVFIALGSTFLITPLQTAEAQQAGQQAGQVTITNRYADGAPLSGMWTTLAQTGQPTKTGFSPVTFTGLTQGATYTAGVGNYQDIKFHHWADNNSTSPTRTFVLGSSSLTLQAIYVSNAHPLPPSGGGGGSVPPTPTTTATITVASTTLTGSQVSGVYTVIKNSAGVVQVAANTPLSFIGTVGQTYTVTPSPYEIFSTGSYTFDHWNDGATGVTKSVNLQSNTSITALYRHNPAGLKTVTLNTALTNGTDLSGIFVNIAPTPRQVIAPQYTPAVWSLEADTAYTLTPQDYGSYFFDHWLDNGSTVRARVVTPSQDTDLTAVFRLTPPDAVAPTVTIQGPSSGQVLETFAVTISGTAADNIGITRLDASVDGSGFVKVDGLVRWSYITEELTEGDHTATIRAYDASGNHADATVNFSISPDPLMNRTGVYVPLYFKPTGAGLAAYQGLIEEKQEHPTVPVIATINPSSGPGPAFDQDIANGMDMLHDAGITVLGYTPTKYGARNIDLVKADIDKYLAWYGDDLDGIFLDEFANNAGYEANYRNLTAYIHGKGLEMSYGNAGTDVPQSYVGTVDMIGITEGDGYAPKSWMQYCITCSANSDGWHYKVDKSNLSVMRYAIDHLSPEYLKEAEKWSGTFYITDGVSPQRWTTLPPYLDQLFELLDD